MYLNQEIFSTPSIAYRKIPCNSKKRFCLYTKKLNFQFIDSGALEAQENMALDQAYLADLQDLPVLHFYDWKKPSLTFGHFIDVKKYLNLEKIAELGLQMAKRPTGGGIVFHLWDFAFSFLMPSSSPFFSENTLENYKFVNRIVLESVQDFLNMKKQSGQSMLSLIENTPLEWGPHCSHFCMARPTIYDVIYKGRKVAGSAQRRTKKGFLHQGTISLAFPNLSLLNECLLSKEELVRAISFYTFAPLGAGVSGEELMEMRQKVRKALFEKFVAKLNETD